MKRPQNMALSDYIEWVQNHELEFEPNDWEKDCWTPRKEIGRVRHNRVLAYWQGKTFPMYQLTYMAWNGIEKNPFNQQNHASHTCDNPECINPLHIVEETPSENEKRKLEGNVDAYRKSQAALIEKARVEGRIMPSGLSHKERAQWILDNCTWKDENGCMRYIGGTDEKGYGRRSITVSPGRTKKVEMHRYIHCMLNDLPYGEDPNDPWNAKGKGFKVAHHKCEQPNCVNPDHIELVSRSRNALSITTSKARKITEGTAREIIEDFLSVSEWPIGSKAAFCKKWAEKTGLSVDVANNIVFRKRNWKPLLEEYNLI